MAERSQPREPPAAVPEIQLRFQFHAEGCALFVFPVGETVRAGLPEERVTGLLVQLCCEFRAGKDTGCARHDIPLRVGRHIPVPSQSSARMAMCVLHLAPANDAAALRVGLLRRQRGARAHIRAIRLAWPDGRVERYADDGSRFYRLSKE